MNGPSGPSCYLQHLCLDPLQCPIGRNEATFLRCSDLSSLFMSWHHPVGDLTETQGCPQQLPEDTGAPGPRNPEPHISVLKAKYDFFFLTFSLQSWGQMRYNWGFSFLKIELRQSGMRGCGLFKRCEVGCVWDGVALALTPTISDWLWLASRLS